MVKMKFLEVKLQDFVKIAHCGRKGFLAIHDNSMKLCSYGSRRNIRLSVVAHLSRMHSTLQFSSGKIFSNAC